MGEFDTRRLIDSERIGLAFSGGGYRSALLGLGVLYYMACSRAIERLHTITSVSGGSYANAGALMYPQDLNDAQGDDLVREFGTFVDRITRVSPWWRWSLVAFYLSFPLLVVFALWGTGLHWLSRSSWGLVLHWSLRVASLIGVLLAVPLFGRVLAASIWKTLFLDHRPSPLLGEEIERTVVLPSAGQVRRTPAARPNVDSVHHVFCTADLHYLRFTYLSNFVVFNGKLGHGTPSGYSVKNAVDASAAIPPIFAPIKLSTKGFLRLPPDAPRRLLSVDGGVHDTLAVEWYSIMDGLPPRIEKPVDSNLCRTPGVVLVVDGSAPVTRSNHVPWTTFPVWRAHIPVLWWLRSHLRSAIVAFSNWDRRNFERLRRSGRIPRRRAQQTTSRGPKRERGSLVAVSVRESPYKLNPDDDQLKVLSQLRVDWGDIVSGNMNVPTWPRKLSRGRVASLIFHGYVLAWTVFTKGTSPKDPLPTPAQIEAEWFGT